MRMRSSRVFIILFAISCIVGKINAADLEKVTAKAHMFHRVDLEKPSVGKEFETEISIDGEPHKLKGLLTAPRVLRDPRLSLCLQFADKSSEFEVVHRVTDMLDGKGYLTYLEGDKEPHSDRDSSEHASLLAEGYMVFLGLPCEVSGQKRTLALRMQMESTRFKHGYAPR